MGVQSGEGESHPVSHDRCSLWFLVGVEGNYGPCRLWWVGEGVGNHQGCPGSLDRELDLQYMDFFK